MCATPKLIKLLQIFVWNVMMPHSLPHLKFGGQNHNFKAQTHQNVTFNLNIFKELSEKNWKCLILATY